MNRRELLTRFIAASVAGGVVSKLPVDTPKISAPPRPAPIPKSSQLIYVECDGDHYAKKITLGELIEYLNEEAQRRQAPYI